MPFSTPFKSSPSLLSLSVFSDSWLVGWESSLFLDAVWEMALLVLRASSLISESSSEEGDCSMLLKSRL